MVRDIMLDIKEKDLLLTDKSDRFKPHFEVIWGNLLEGDDDSVLYCNIVVSKYYIFLTTFDANGECQVRFSAPYKADTRLFTIRLVKYQDDTYSLLDGFSSYVSNTKASHLPLVDIDGTYLALVKNNGTAKIYSSKETDLKIDFSDDQAAHLLMACMPGSNYRYPTTGVGISKYLNTVVEHTDLLEVLESQFEADGKPLTDASFDSATGEFSIAFTAEQEQEDENLTSPEYLDTSIFQQFLD